MKNKNLISTFQTNYQRTNLARQHLNRAIFIRWGHAQFQYRHCIKLQKLDLVQSAPVHTTTNSISRISSHILHANNVMTAPVGVGADRLETLQGSFVEERFNPRRMGEELPDGKVLASTINIFRQSDPALALGKQICFLTAGDHNQCLPFPPEVEWNSSRKQFVNQQHNYLENAHTPKPDGRRGDGRRQRKRFSEHSAFGSWGRRKRRNWNLWLQFILHSLTAEMDEKTI